MNEFEKIRFQCVIVKDINPKAKHHYLVISKKHISKPTDLTVGDIPLCKYSKNLFSLSKMRKY